ncbi:thiolase family protein [Streptomyces pseudovenezuelae]|uniref:thiolase family protein n=1 Tax=Streptomyces pseudovenezuelae TaxID=67350 RepID=UPI0036E9AC02
MQDERIVILNGARTPIGSFGGALSPVPAHELGATAAREALRRSGVDPADVDEVIMGCVGQVGADTFNARRVAMAAGLPTHVPAFTVNRLCGSGLQAVWSAGMQLRCGDADIVLAGGDESMSRMPFYDFGARSGYRLSHRELADGTLMMLTDPFHRIPMGITAEYVAEKYHVSRQEQDEFAVESQRRCAAASASGIFADEIVPVEIAGRRTQIVNEDEHPRPGTSLETLQTLRPAFRTGGTVTAGNSSGINDGAAALVVARETAAITRGLRPLVALEAVAAAALVPELMGYAPVLALRKLFEKTGTAPSDIDVFEVNEAFAAQAVACIRDAKLDPGRVNPHGGAIALGHPVGATGAILTLRIAQDLVRRDLELGVVTLCIGGGQALAAMFRRL